MPYKFSPSSLSLLIDCPRCFWLAFNEGIKRPEGIFPTLPSGMDRILKEHFDRFMMYGRLPPELEQLEGVKLFNNKELLDEWRNNRKGIRWKDGHENTLMGALDNLLQKGDKLIVLDYKTRGYPPKEDTHSHYQHQMDIYNFLLRKNGFATEEYSYLLFYHPDKVTPTGEVIFHKQLVKVPTDPKRAEELFERALEVLGKECPEANGCSWCKNIFSKSDVINENPMKKLWDNKKDDKIWGKYV